MGPPAVENSPSLHLSMQTKLAIAGHIPYTPPLTPSTSTSDLSSSKNSEYFYWGHTETHRSDLPTVAVIGVGYVGSHLVETFAKTHNVVAFDLSEARLHQVAADMKDDARYVHFSNRPDALGVGDFFLISVPTVLNADKSIDTTYLRAAVDTVGQYARTGSTIIVESSVAVGMTRKLLAPLAAARGLKVCMSPERVDPGRVSPAFHTVPKVIAGIDDESLKSIASLYRYAFDTLVPVSSLEVAEMTKLYENCQRMVCAAYANEMADACWSLGIDAWEVCEAAATKPFGYAAYRPGPGIGGHCIPINPYYLLSTCDMPVLKHATERSWQRPAMIADRFMKELERFQSKRSIGEQGAAKRILVVGMGFKRGQSVLSQSPGVALMCQLMDEWEAHAEFADPLVKQSALPRFLKMDTDKNWTQEYLESFDGIIVAINQEGLDIGLLSQLDGVMVQNYSPTS